MQASCPSSSVAQAQFSSRARCRRPRWPPRSGSSRPAAPLRFGSARSRRHARAGPARPDGRSAARPAGRSGRGRCRRTPHGSSSRRTPRHGRPAHSLDSARPSPRPRRADRRAADRHRRGVGVAPPSMCAFAGPERTRAPGGGTRPRPAPARDAPPAGNPRAWNCPRGARSGWWTGRVVMGSPSPALAAPAASAPPERSGTTPCGSPHGPPLPSDVPPPYAVFALRFGAASASSFYCSASRARNQCSRLVPRAGLHCSRCDTQLRAHALG